jgi:L-fuculose-phosphate aldolase
VFATGFATAGIPLNKSMLPEVVIALGEIPLVPYGTPSTDEMFDALAPFIADHDALLLANHGVLTVGGDVFNALYKLEMVEQFAQIAYVASRLGDAQVLSRAQVDRLFALRSGFGLETNTQCLAAEDLGPEHS